MLSVQAELCRIQAMLTAPASERYAELYAAQQALMWVMDSAMFKAPSEMLVSGTQAGSEDCQAEIGHSEFSGNRDHRAA